MLVRIAKAAEAGLICTILRRSISELCAGDHGHDPERLAAWLANKTPENVEKWLLNRDNRAIVATIHGEIAGVGLASLRGEILLNYVSPDFRFRGASKAILAFLERELLALGVTEIHLTSTVTAHEFYQRQGYRDVADQPVGHRAMRKTFSAV